MTSTRPNRLRLPALLVAVAAAAMLVAGCSSKDSTATTTTEASPDQAQQITVAGYTFTMNPPDTNPTELPFPEGTFVDIQGFDISKDGTKIMSAYSTTLPSGEPGDATTVDKLLAAAKATDPQPGEVQGQPFTSATLPDGRVLILAASGEQVAVAIGQDRDQMIQALTETAQAPPDQTDQPTPPDQ